MIIDAHAHIFATVQGQTGSGPTRPLAYGKVRVGDEVQRVLPPTARTTAFPPEVLLEHMDWAGVDRAVLLQGPFYGEANAYVWEAVRRWPDRFIGAAYVDPCAPNAHDTFRQLTDELGFRVIKFELSERTGLVGLHPGLRVDGPEMDWMWREAADRGLVITLDLGAVGSASYQTQAVRTVLGRYPSIAIVIAHLAQPPVGASGDPALDRLWQEQVRLALHPSVWLDLAALPAYAIGEDYPYPSVTAYIRRAAEMVGPEKLLWGTDAPGLLSHATYPQLLTYITRHCPFFSPPDLEKVVGLTAWHVYGQSQ